MIFKSTLLPVTKTGYYVTTNKHGLGRDLPAAVAREVRQRDGFGCVRCGSAYYEFDHLDTEFKDATVHDPDQIVSLCAGCHALKTRKVLSRETLQALRLTPKCKQAGFSWGPLDFGLNFPVVVMGNIRAKNVASLITIDGESIFSVSRPSGPGLPFGLNASVFDKEGRQIMKVINNEFQSSTTNWDVEIEGPRISIKSALGIFDLKIRLEPPVAIVIERLYMVYRDMHISCWEGKPTIISRNGSDFESVGIEFENCLVGILVQGSKIHFGHGGSIVLREITINSPTMQFTMGGYAPFAAPLQSRNALCRCNSGLRFKHCHGRVQ